MYWDGGLPWVSNFSCDLKAVFAQNDGSSGLNRPSPMPFVTHRPMQQEGLHVREQGNSS
jgi:hypothetical protein